MNSDYKKCVLVVHCVDTEGPIGGDIRRKPDGSKEFMDNWRDIRASLKRLTNDHFRYENCDSFGNPYIFNWFIMDFTGFKTNPKNRVGIYNDTYDNLKSLDTWRDSFYWHYHQPPASGIGDQWSDNWDSSDEHLKILLHRLVERLDFPEAFRAGGTIEDNECSLWLEDNIMLDYSNRVSDKSHKTDNIFDFNWCGAPDHWGYYHPDSKDFTKKGNMRRFIVRCVDLWSRLHKLTESEVVEAFECANKENKPVILSYFSHDHRDMNKETNFAISLLKKVSVKKKIPWKICNALEAVQICEKIKPEFVNVKWENENRKIIIKFDKKIYQKSPYVGVMEGNGEPELLSPVKTGVNSFSVLPSKNARKMVVGGTSLSGNKFVKQIDL